MNTNQKIIGAIIVMVLGVFFYVYRNTYNNLNSTSTKITSTATTTITETARKYKDGTYTINQTYLSAGGKQNLGVTVTLFDDKITNTVIKNGGTDGDSKSYQNFFSIKVSSSTVGNSIDNLKLNTTSGASLTTKAFNDALIKIRKQGLI